MSVSHEHPRTEEGYQGTVDIFFNKSELRNEPYPDHQKTALRVFICTKGLTLEPIGPETICDYGEDPLIKETDSKTWADRWETNNPWSVLVAKEETSSKLIGRVVLDYGDQPGHATLSFVIAKAFEDRGYESEMVTPVVREWSELLVQRGDQIPSGEELKSHPFVAIDATASEGTAEAALFDSLMTRVERESEEGEIHYEKRVTGDKV